MTVLERVYARRLLLGGAVRDAQVATYRLRDVPSVQVALTLLGMTLDCVEDGVPIPASSGYCLNCDRQGLPFCSERCDQEAALVRYVRRAIVEGRLRNAGVTSDGIGIRLLMIYAGGYPRRARYIPRAVRDAVMHRDGGLCQICGAGGTEIDHITDDAAAMSNLRLLCGSCNRGRVNNRVVLVDPDEEKRLIELTWRLATRIASEIPLRVCDDEQSWARRWREFRKPVQRG